MSTTTTSMQSKDGESGEWEFPRPRIEATSQNTGRVSWEQGRERDTNSQKEIYFFM